VTKCSELLQICATRTFVVTLDSARTSNAVAHHICEGIAMSPITILRERRTHARAEKITL